MKIILTAFGGKLRSEIQDWPENTNDRVHLLMNMDTMRFSGWSGQDVIPPKEPILKQGTFAWTGKYLMIGKDNPKEYILIDVS